MPGALGAVGGILGGIGSIAGSFKKPKAPKIPAPFQGTLTTPSLSLEGGTLSRTGSGLDPALLQGSTALLGNLAGSINDLRGQLPGLRAGLGGIGSNLESLQGMVVPGQGAITEANVTAIKNAAAESIGNLRESLGRRGVLGSSFAADAQSRATLAAGQAEAAARAQGKMAEINATTQLLAARAQNYAQMLGLTEADANLLSAQIAPLTAQAQILSKGLDQELQELGTIGNIRNNVSAVVNQQAIAQAQINALFQAQGAYNQGAGFANLGTNLSSIGSGISSLFGLGSSAPSTQPSLTGNLNTNIFAAG